MDDLIKSIIKKDDFKLFKDINTYEEIGNSADASIVSIIKNHEINNMKKLLKKVEITNNREETLKLNKEFNLFPTKDGFFKETFETFKNNSLFKQDILCIGATISMLGHCFSKKYTIRFNNFITPLNLYTLTVADTGRGKDAANGLIKKILAGCYLTSGDVLGRVSSGEAIEDALVRKNNRYAVLDEVSHFFKSMKTNQYQANIESILLELYSASRGVYYPRSKANQELDTPPINNPILNFYGTTTPTSLFDVLKSKDIASGLLPRFLLFSSEMINQKAYIKRNMKKVDHEIIINKIEDILMPESFPKTIILNDEAIKYYYDKIDEYVNIQNNIKRSIFSRVCENGLKIAGILAVCDDKLKPIINYNHIEYAIAMSSYSATQLYSFVTSYMSESTRHTIFNEVLNFIKFNNGCTKTVINKEFRKITPIQRDEILNDLIDQEEIEKTSVIKGSRSFYKYYIINK
tara:strand:- start:480 stop:1868 length:1389 start_codon:yes stop_codon:yes gene_type:complete